MTMFLFGHPSRQTILMSMKWLLLGASGWDQWINPFELAVYTHSANGQTLNFLGLHI